MRPDLFGIDGPKLGVGQNLGRISHEHGSGYGAPLGFGEDADFEDADRRGAHSRPHMMVHTVTTIRAMTQTTGNKAIIRRPPEAQVRLQLQGHAVPRGRYPP